MFSHLQCVGAMPAVARKKHAEPTVRYDALPENHGPLSFARLQGAGRSEEDAGILHTLLDAMPYGLLIADDADVVRHCNREAARIFGCGMELLAGRVVESLIADEDRLCDLACWRAFKPQAQFGQMSPPCELHGRRVNGRSFPLEVRLCRLRLDGALRLLIAVTDLSARKQRERELDAERERRAHLARVSMLGELSGSLVHELNQPLTAILSNAQAAQRILQRDPSDLAQVQEILADIVDTDRRASQLISRLRSLFRREARERVPLRMNDVVQSSMQLMRSDLLGRGISCRVHLMPGLPDCMGDQIQLQQVVMNLIRNACEAVSDSPASRIIRIRTLRSAFGICTDVVDAGPGIPEDRIGRVFAPFETSKPAGMGMGLAVCRTIVRAHGGRIWAENREPGARFAFELPVSRRVVP